MLFLLAVSCSALAFDPNAGLPTPPEFTNNKQLESKFKSLTFEALKTQAEQGSPASQAELGRRYLTGEGTPTNALLGVDWTLRAATNGLALAQFNLGRAYENGTGVAKDLSTAAEWYRRAVEQNLPSAAHQLARLTEQRALPELEPKDSLRLYELAAEQGDLEAAYQLAQLYLNPPGGGEIKGEHAAYWLNFAATKAYVPAYSGMGFYYLFAKGNLKFREPDYQEAERWFRMGLEGGDPGCEYGMAMLELRAHKTSPNIAEIRKWLLKSASKDYADAFYQLGRLSELRDLPPNASLHPDLKEAAQWYQRATELDHFEAADRLVELGLSREVQIPNMIDLLRRASDLHVINARVELAMRYHKGESHPRNEGESVVALIKSAANYGNARAKMELFRFYSKGTYVHQDLIEAMYWLFSAARYGSGEAEERIQLLQKGADGEAQSLTTDERSLQQAFDDYVAAMRTSKPEPAAVLAHRYLDGTYLTNSFRAGVWFSVAGKRNDPQAAEAAKRSLAPLSQAERERAQELANSLFLDSTLRSPRF